MNPIRRFRVVEPILWVIAVLALGVAVIAWRQASGPAFPVAPVRLAPPAALSPWPADSLTRAATAITASDPFRLDRRPADVAYHAASNGTLPPPPPPAPPTPSLAIAGFVGGPPWAALLDGVPGRNGSVVVHAGDVVGALTIRKVGKDTVIVRGMDTTWTLTLKHPWR